MGKLIRTIEEINIGKNSFRIEENEAVPNSNNSSMHIQDEFLRLEMSKSELLQICCGLLYSNEQMKIIKESDHHDAIISTKRSRLVEDEVFLAIPHCFYDNKGAVLLSTVVDEMDCFSNGYGISFLVNKEDIDQISKELVSQGFIRAIHPMGWMSDYKLLYNLSNFYRWENKEKRLAINLYSEMHCLSLMKKTCVPMSERINRDAKDNPIWDQRKKVFKMNEISETVYWISKCIFMFAGFDDVYINLLRERKEVIASEPFREELGDLFYNYTDRLIELLLLDEYRTIYSDYISYRRY